MNLASRLFSGSEITVAHFRLPMRPQVAFTVKSQLSGSGIKILTVFVSAVCTAEHHDHLANSLVHMDDGQQSGAVLAPT
jgi:hypothetical protein